MRHSASGFCSRSARGVYLAILASLFVVHAHPVQAVIVNLNVSGVVSEVTPAVSGVFALNDPMSAVITYDTEAPAGPSLILTQLLYAGAISGATYAIGGYGGTAAGGNINVENDDPTFHDAVTFRAAGLSSASIGTHDPVIFGARFFDPTEAALGSLALPTSTADLAGFADLQWGLTFTPLSLAGIDPIAFVGGRITSVTITQVSEPTTLALLGLGLAGFGFRLRRRKIH